jgi:carbonic anhydrase/acetyltransferase-like protein (isoleucine patch superfamily)
MILEHRGRSPVVDPTCRIAPTAVVCGDVTIEAGTSIGFGAVLVAESGPITVGRDCVVMENAVLRGVANAPLALGDRCLVGPGAHLTGCTIGAEVFLATGATVFNGARVGARSEVRINGIVHLRTVLAEDTTVPIGWVAVGDPAVILPADQHEAIWAVQKALEFPRYVFGVERPAAGETMMTATMPRYAAFLRKSHADDREL